jgi:hypothetical protein
MGEMYSLVRPLDNRTTQLKASQGFRVLADVAHLHVLRVLSKRAEHIPHHGFDQPGVCGQHGLDHLVGELDGQGSRGPLLGHFAVELEGIVVGVDPWRLLLLRRRSVRGSGQGQVQVELRVAPICCIERPGEPLDALRRCHFFDLHGWWLLLDVDKGKVQNPKGWSFGSVV